MRRLQVIAGCVVTGLSVSLLTACSTGGDAARTALSVSNTPSTQSHSTDPNDPSNWSDKRLAASLVIGGVYTGNGDVGDAKKWAKMGIAGITMVGDPPMDLPQKLQAVRNASPQHRILISADEEGGYVQSLDKLIGKIPSATTMGTYSTKKVRKLGQQTGNRLRWIGVNFDLAPVADLSYDGKYMFRNKRTFGSTPEQASKYARAFNQGLNDADVMGVLKHWPGHGFAANTHVGAGETKSWAKMEKEDARSFDLAMGSTQAVMVGHLIVPGLTEPNVPVSQSPQALSILRQKLGNDKLIITDSLSMGAVTSAMHQSVSKAAVRALKSGADLALAVSVPAPTLIKAITKAIQSGKLSREQAIEKVRRVVKAQDRWKIG